MIHKKIAISFLLILFFKNPCFPQIGQSQITNLDSLLLNGNFKTFMERWDEFSRTTKIQRIPLEYSENYEWIMNLFRQISTANDEKIKELCLTFKNSVLISRPTHREKKAAITFQKFLDAIAIDKYRDGLFYYYTTIFFERRYFQLEEIRLKKNYYAAVDFYIHDNYDSVAFYIHSFKYEDQKNPAMNALGDSLSFLYNELQEKMDSKINQNKIESAGSTLKKKLTISIDYGSINRGSTYDPNLVLHHVISSNYDIHLESFSEENRMAYKILCEYYINQIFSLGARVTTGKIHSKDQWTYVDIFHVEENSTSLGITGTYFFTNKSTIRPYTRLEIGIIRLTRNQVELKQSDFLFNSFEKVDAVDELYPQSVIEYGFEHEFVDSHLFFGLHVYLSNHFGDERILRHYSLGVGIHMGVNIF